MSNGTTDLQADNKHVVERYWAALARRDWDGLKALLTDDAHYTDVGSPGPGGTGPDGVVARLKIGLEPLEGYDHLPGAVLVAEGDTVITEHVERWRFHTGEVIDHPFVSVMQLRGGKIFRWHDYSNLSNITDNAPAWWIEHIVKASTAPG